jgi:hypothetical protein
MKSITHCRICVACTMIFLQALLLVGCSAKKDAATPLPTDNMTMQSDSSMPAPEITSSQERQLLDASDYDVSYDVVALQDLLIPSFDFLSDFENLKELTITDCTIAENAVLPHIDTLKQIKISGIDGQSVFDFINGSLPLPNLQYLLVIDETTKNDTALNEIPSLSFLIVQTADPIEAVKYNSQIENLVIATDGYGRGDIQNLNGLEEFKNLKSLTVRAQFNDLSALSSCDNLEYLTISYAQSITTLKPLFALQKLATIEMDYQAYLGLPQEDRDHFNFGNNDELDTAQIFCHPGG